MHHLRKGWGSSRWVNPTVSVTAEKTVTVEVLHNVSSPGLHRRPVKWTFLSQVLGPKCNPSHRQHPAFSGLGRERELTWQLGQKWHWQDPLFFVCVENDRLHEG